MMTLNKNDDKWFEIRLATVCDAGGIVRFMNQAGYDTDFMSFGGNGYKHNEEQEVASLKRAIVVKDEVTLVVIDTKSLDIIGTGKVVCVGRRSRHVWDLGLVVAKKHWRKGIGRALMIRLMDVAKERGAERITLDLNAENVAALSLYKSLGFVEEGLLKKQVKFTNGNYGDIILMALKAT